MARRWLEEHMYRNIVPMTHEQFMDEPRLIIRRTIAIQGLIDSDK